MTEHGFKPNGNSSQDYTLNHPGCAVCRALAVGWLGRNLAEKDRSVRGEPDE